MILLSRLNGSVFALNPDLIERADHTPDTVITLVDGTKYVVAEPLEEFLLIVRRYRAGILADAEMLVSQGPQEPGLFSHPERSENPAPEVIHLHRRGQN